MGILLDTSVLIDVERGVAALPGEGEDTAIAAITAAELLRGVHRADRVHRARREAFVEQLLVTIPTVPFTLSIARVHARLWAEIDAHDRYPGAHDLEIAATAVALDWALATTNTRDFEGIPGLRLMRP